MSLYLRHEGFVCATGGKGKNGGGGGGVDTRRGIQFSWGSNAFKLQFVAFHMLKVHGD